MFVLQSLLFAGILCLFDWNSLNTELVYGNLLQGVFFGVFMTAYSYWDDKRKKKHKEDSRE